MWLLASPQLLLGSASPRRLELLRQLQIPVEQIVLEQQADDEPRLHEEPVIEYVVRTSGDKNRRVLDHIQSHAPMLEDLPVLTADTTVAIGQSILGKPHDDSDARQTLRQLSGQTHDVYTAVTLSWREQTLHALSHSRVTFRNMTDQEIAAYVRTGQANGKAGAYGIQGCAAAFVSRIEGSYTGIVGLPLFETTRLMLDMKLLRAAN